MMQAMVFVFGNNYYQKETYRGLDDDQLTYLGLPALAPHYNSHMDTR